MLKFKKEKSEIEKTIDEKIKKKVDEAETNEELSNALELMRQKEVVKNEKSKRSASKDALIGAGVALAQIGLILLFENRHVFTTRALPFVKKPKC